MGKKSRSKTRKKWIKLKPDEVATGGHLRMERYGRFVHFSSNFTSEEHAEVLKRTQQAHQDIVRELEKEVPALQSLVQKHHPAELLHRAAYMLLPLFFEIQIGE